jgi:archaemetzincin
MGQWAKNNKVIFFIWLYFIVFASGFFLSNAKCTEVSNHMERKILLLPIGEIERWVLDVLEKDLEKKFDCKVKRLDSIEVPRDAFNPARSQYYSSFILNKLHGLTGPEKQDKVLGITDVDLYTAGLNFVFGEAEFGGQLAVISLPRLRQSFYSLPENKALFLERTKKEAVHELAHMFGLEHCPDPECVMHFSNSLLDTDRKSASFCSKCQARLEKFIN